MAAVFILLVAGRIPGALAANEWQLGWSNDQSTGYYGAGANQLVDGSLPSNDSFWNEIGFVENYTSAFLDMSTGSNNGGNVYVGTEALPKVGSPQDMTLCNGISEGVYNTDKIVWNSSSSQWDFTSTCGSTGAAYGNSTIFPNG